MIRSAFSLPACPLWVLADNRQALAESDARRHRQLLIERAECSCQKCGLVAWSSQRMKQLELRPKRDLHGAPTSEEWVLCRECSAAYDSKKQRSKQRRAS